MILKVLASVVLMVLLLSMFTSAYAMWNDRLKANIKVSTGDLDARFKCFKIITCGCKKPPSTYHTSGKIVNNGKKFIGEFENVYPNWRAVVALVIENTGTLPETLIKVNVRVSGDNDLLRIFEYKVCVLGPFGRKIFDSPYWTRLNHDIVNNVICKRRLVLDPGEKALVIIPMEIHGFSNSTDLKMEVTFDFAASW